MNNTPEQLAWFKDQLRQTLAHLDSPETDSVAWQLGLARRLTLIEGFIKTGAPSLVKGATDMETPRYLLVSPSITDYAQSIRLVNELLETEAIELMNGKIIAVDLREAKIWFDKTGWKALSVNIRGTNWQSALTDPAQFDR